MRTRVFYACVVGAAFVWLIADTAADMAMERIFATAGPRLAVWQAALAYLSLMSARWVVPGALLVPVFGVPVLTAVGAATIRFSPERPVRFLETVTWLAIGLVSSRAAWGLMACVGDSRLLMRLLAPLFLSGATAHALVVVCTYQAQKALHTRGLSRVPGWCALAVGMVLQLACTFSFAWEVSPGVLAAAIPLFSGWRHLAHHPSTTAPRSEG